MACKNHGGSSVELLRHIKTKPLCALVTVLCALGGIGLTTKSHKRYHEVTQRFCSLLVVINRYDFPDAINRVPTISIETNLVMRHIYYCTNFSHRLLKVAHFIPQFLIDMTVVFLPIMAWRVFLPPASFWHTISPTTKAVLEREVVMKKKGLPLPWPECMLKNVSAQKQKGPSGKFLNQITSYIF